MKLRFYARPGHLLSLPGVKVTGTRPRYVGRRVVKVGNPNKPTIVNQPTAMPDEFDSDSPEGQRLVKRMMLDRQDPPLWPADVETARACGYEFVEVERSRDDGEHYPKASDRPVALSKPVKPGKDA